MFTIAKATLANNNGFEQQSLKEAKLMDKTVSLSSKKKGLNFFDADGTLFCYARFSNSVRQHLADGTMTIDQLLNQGFITASEFEGQTYYNLVLPNELRGGQSFGKVSDIVKNSKKLVRKAVTIADISKMIEV